MPSRGHLDFRPIIEMMVGTAAPGKEARTTIGTKTAVVCPHLIETYRPALPLSVPASAKYSSPPRRLALLSGFEADMYHGLVAAVLAEAGDDSVSTHCQWPCARRRQEGFPMRFRLDTRVGEPHALTSARVKPNG
jgi:hypothetical protein